MEAVKAAEKVTPLGPGPVRERVAPLPAASVAAAVGPPALAEEIGDAAQRLAADRNSGTYLQGAMMFCESGM